MLLALAVASLSHAQEGPINGMRPSNPARHALVGAKVIVAPGTTLEKATILVRDGVVEEIGAELAVPAGYRVFDLTGKTVFPAFIEPALIVDSTDAQSAALRAPGAAPSARNAAGQTPLHLAVQCAYFAGRYALLRAGAVGFDDYCDGVERVFRGDM